MSRYDVIVLGLGGIGSATAAEFARRGARTLGIDRFSGGHDRGSSHGATRVIRQAYFEHPDYVPLLRDAYAGWARLEQATGQVLFQQVGLLQVGPADGDVLQGVCTSATQHGLAVENLTAKQVHHRFPQFAVPSHCEGVFESSAGLLLVEACVLAHLSEAARLGAQLLHNVTIESWEAQEGGIVVRSADETWKAKRLVLTAGAWAGELLGSMGQALVVRRKHLHWLGGTPGTGLADGMPTFLFELPTGIFYGFPGIDDQGVKVGEHSGGTIVDDPTSDSRAPELEDQQRVAAFVTQCLSGLAFNVLRHTTCLYTMSPDEHFLVDRYPGEDRIVFAAGLSGHGFKFAPVLARALADLALEGGSELPIDFLSLNRR